MPQPHVQSSPGPARVRPRTSISLFVNKFIKKNGCPRLYLCGAGGGRVGSSRARGAEGGKAKLVPAKGRPLEAPAPRTRGGNAGCVARGPRSRRPGRCHRQELFTGPAPRASHWPGRRAGPGAPSRSAPGNRPPSLRRHCRPGFSLASVTGLRGHQWETGCCAGATSRPWGRERWGAAPGRPTPRAQIAWVRPVSAGAKPADLHRLLPHFLSSVPGVSPVPQTGASRSHHRVRGLCLSFPQSSGRGGGARVRRCREGAGQRSVPPFSPGSRWPGPWSCWAEASAAWPPVTT